MFEAAEHFIIVFGATFVAVVTLKLVADFMKAGPRKR